MCFAIPHLFHCLSQHPDHGQYRRVMTTSVTFMEKLHTAENEFNLLLLMIGYKFVKRCDCFVEFEKLQESFQCVVLMVKCYKSVHVLTKATLASGLP